MRPAAVARHVLVLALFASVAVGCDDLRRKRPKPTSTAASGVSCDGAGAAYGRYLGDGFVKSTGNARKADLIRKGAAESVVDSCKADKWPDKVLSCLASSRTDTMESCVSQLPADAQSRMADRVATKIASIAGSP